MELGRVRFLVFTILFAPLALFVLMAILFAGAGFPNIEGVLISLLFAYVIASPLGWATAFFDWMLRTTPIYVRLCLTSGAAACFAWLTALSYGLVLNRTNDVVV